MRIIRFLSAMSFLWCVFAVASPGQSVQSDFDRSVDLSRLKTFNFAVQRRSPKDPLAQNALNDERIKNALVSELQAKGFKYETDSKTDFVVAYYVASKNRIGLNDYSYGPPRWFGARDIQVYQYTEGTLMVDLVAPATNRVVWRGHASDTIELKNIDRKITKAVGKLVGQLVKDSKKRGVRRNQDKI